MDIFHFLQYSFIQNAFLVGFFVSVTCSLLGLFLVLRKMSMIGDGLSHVSFGAIALGLFFGVYPLYVAVPVVIIASLLILQLSQKARMYGDAAIGIVSAVGIAVGVILASISGGFNIDLFSYLFGNILAIGSSEVIFSLILSLCVLLALFVLYWDLFSVTFDEEYARTTGIKTSLIQSLLTVLTAITVILSVRVVGVMLVSALLILPAVTALQLSRRFTSAMIVSSLCASVSVFVGIPLSFFFDLPTGASIVLLNAFFFATAFFFRKVA